jgi:hypothetical protein
MSDKNGLDTIMEKAALITNGMLKNESTKKEMTGGAPKKLGRPKKTSKKESKKTSKKKSKKNSKKVLKRTSKKNSKKGSKKTSKKGSKKTKK